MIGIGVAFLLAWLLVRVRVPFRGFIELSLWIAYFLPSLPLAISWILLTDPHYGFLNRFLSPLGITLDPYTVTGIVWVHLTASTIPMMASRLPRRAVAGEVSPLRPSMNSTAEAR